MSRLSLSTLAALPAPVARPAYDPTRVTVGIVHLGSRRFSSRAPGGVHRRRARARFALGHSRRVDEDAALDVALSPQQDGLYALLVKGNDESSVRVIGALRETAFARRRRGRACDTLADPRVTCVTLTVTEKGYCHDPGERTPRFRASGHRARPGTSGGAGVRAPGLLVAALAARRHAQQRRTMNIVCCDNLPHNGRVVEGLVRELAQRRGRVARRLDGAHTGRFPETMVDRIVPATTDADIAEVERRIGVHDAAPVVAEPYNQWVIEDRFVAARPAWESAGATLVRNVEPFETLKLRMLNGSHSTLAYLGYLSGYDTIAKAASDPALAAFVERQMAEEIAPTLVAPPGVRIADYGAELMRRFRNPALPHRTRQVAMDGSQKLPQRLLGTIRDNLAAGRPIERLTLSVASWMRYVYGRDERATTRSTLPIRLRRGSRRSPPRIAVTSRALREGCSQSTRSSVTTSRASRDSRSRRSRSLRCAVRERDRADGATMRRGNSSGTVAFSER